MSTGVDLNKQLRKVLRVFLDESLYPEDLKYFSYEVTPEQQYRNFYEICFNVAEYITWLFMDRPEPYPLEQMNPYMKPHELYPSTPPTRWADFPVERDGVYKIYMTNDKEHHEFVVAVLGEDLYVLSGYGGWHRPIYRKVDKYDWIDEIYDYMNDTVNADDYDYRLVEYSNIFGLPLSISSRVYTDGIPPNLTDEMWYVTVI